MIGQLGWLGKPHWLCSGRLPVGELWSYIHWSFLALELSWMGKNRKFISSFICPAKTNHVSYIAYLTFPHILGSSTLKHMSGDRRILFFQNLYCSFWDPGLEMWDVWDVKNRYSFASKWICFRNARLYCQVQYHRAWRIRIWKPVWLIQQDTLL